VRLGGYGQKNICLMGNVMQATSIKAGEAFYQVLKDRNMEIAAAQP